jgi:hypothetical protein
MIRSPATEASLETVIRTLEKVWREGRSARVVVHFNGKRFTGYELTEFKQIEDDRNPNPGPAPR